MDGKTYSLIKEVDLSFTIGTRGSLLAVTQCGQIKDLLEKNSGKNFELDLIKTQGDLDTSKPLWQMDGKDFFTKELDEALLGSKVDMVVHSYKDLGSERPEGIKLAAVTKRKFAHDILLISKETISKLNEKSSLVVGTSSPRRITNLEYSLSEYVPNGANLKVETKMLRGNVNTRIKKLRDGDYDAIVLALPGIERLALTESSRQELAPLLEGLNFAILPTTTFPSAASQGALGIECRTEGSLDLKEILNSVSDANTISEVKREREIFQQYGGGCHLAVGINVRRVDDEYFLHIEKGESDNKRVSKIRLEGPKADFVSGNIFIGLPADKVSKKINNAVYDELVSKVALEVTEPKDNSHLYVTSRYGVPKVSEWSNKKSNWVSGNTTWKALASAGFWVNGSADGLGERELELLRSSKAVQMLLDEDNDFPLLSLTSNESTFGLGETLSCYKRELNETSEEYVEALKAVSAFYWTSFDQYTKFCEKFPFIKTKLQCCGLGKTREFFKNNKIDVTPFGEMKEFYEWANATEK